MKQLRIYRSMGGTFGVGWPRDDMPGVIHLFANVRSGDPFQPTNGRGGPHWPCATCKKHGFTEQDFHDQIQAALEKGPE